VSLLLLQPCQSQSALERLLWVTFNFMHRVPECAFVLPQNVQDWLPPEHLCWKVLAVVEEVDMSQFLAGYRADGQGRAAYHPVVMLALVLYCYSKGIRSSRRIEAACLDDVGCRIITANRRVDHSTIARFIRRHRPALKTLFVQVLALCASRGLVDVSVVAVDGSPMEANASREANRSLDRLDTVIARTEADIDALMQETADLAQQTEQTDGELLESPPRQACTAVVRLSRLSDRLGRARSAKDKLHQRALPSIAEIKIKIDAAERMVARAEHRLTAVTAAQQIRLEEYARRARQDQAAGRRGANGRPPVPVEAKTVIVRQRTRLARARTWAERARHPRPVPSPTAQASLTDPDSRLMLRKRGGYCQGYNLQIVCARNQVLLAIDVHDNPADMTALVPMVKQTQRNCAAAAITDHVQAWLADGGYASAANFQALTKLPLLVAVTRERTQAGRASSPGDKLIPAGQREMAARLATPGGSNLYKRRSALVEPGFAQLFQRFGRHLHYRGTDGVDTEIKLLGAVHNLNKLFLAHAKNTT
jgi:transposase